MNNETYYDFQEFQNNPIQMKPNKKLIIVVGNMGDGKSSFINMLAKQDVPCRNDAKSVTKKQDFYQMDPNIAKKIGFQSNQTIYIMDTPGLDSGFDSKSLNEETEKKNKEKTEKTANADFVISLMDKITPKIIEQKYEVISLIYIINPNSGRLFREDGQSQFSIFHKRFPLIKQVKQKISFIVYTHYDKMIGSPQEYQQKTDSIFKEMEKNGIKFGQKVMNWMSQPTADLQEFKQKLLSKEKIQNHQKAVKKLKKLIEEGDQDLTETLEDKIKSYEIKQKNTDTYNKQWQELGKRLQSNKKNRQTFSEFFKGLKKLDDQISIQISKWLVQRENGNNNGPIEQDTVEYQFKTVLKAQDQKDKSTQGLGEGVFSSTAGGVVGAGTTAAIVTSQAVAIEAAGATFVGWSVGGTAVAATSTTAATTTGGVLLGAATGTLLAWTGVGLAIGLIGFGGHKLYKYITHKKISVQQINNNSGKLRQELQIKAKISAKLCCLNNIKNGVTFEQKQQQNYLIVKKSEWFQNCQLIEPSDVQLQQDKKIKQIQQLKLVENQNYKLKFEIFIPSSQKILDLMKTASLQTFYK